MDVQRILATEFGVLRSLPGVYHLLHHLGYSYLRPRPRHRRANPGAHEQFKLDLPARLQLVREKYPQQRLRVHFQDESRFAQQGTTTNVWARLTADGCASDRIPKEDKQKTKACPGDTPRLGRIRRRRKLNLKMGERAWHASPSGWGRRPRRA